VSLSKPAEKRRKERKSDGKVTEKSVFLAGFIRKEEVKAPGRPVSADREFTKRAVLTKRVFPGLSDPRLLAP